MALFRGEDSRVRAVDAYCPHLGASLSAGGRVLGNCIECPFHGWRFDGDTGKCNHIPYAENSKNIELFLFFFLTSSPRYRFGQRSIRQITQFLTILGPYRYNNLNLH